MFKNVIYIIFFVKFITQAKDLCVFFDNSYKILRVYDVYEEDDNIYEIRYIPELHHIRDIEIYKDGKIIRRTIDNGSGVKIWD